MAEPSLSDQSYGHFGQPVYNVQTKSWIFGRSAINSWHYQPLGGISRTIAGTKDLQGEEASTLRKEAKRQDKRYDRALIKEIRSVVQGNPELQAAEDILNPLVRSSEAVIAAIALYDPAVGDILAFCTAVVSDGQNRRNKARLLAIPGGEGGEALRLVQIETETYAWDEQDARLLVPSPNDEVGWWVGKGAPVQQICTPEILLQHDHGSFVAVRLSGATLLFRPRYRATPVPPAGVHLGCTIPPSRIDANLLLELLPSNRQGQQHADVAFNPWNQHQLAVVDQAGDWTIFKLQREHKGSDVYKSKVVHRGSLELYEQGAKTREQATAVQQDGWARIQWVADTNTLLICTRCQFQLFSLSQETTLSFSTFLPKNQWFLDVRRCPTLPSWLFVLTSTQVLWLEILPESDRGVDVTAKPGKILLSAHHFRDPSDLSLQINIENDSNGISILLWSRNGPLVTCIRFDRPEAINGLPSIVGVPTELLLPLSGKNNTLAIAALSVRCLDYEAEADAASTVQISRPTIHSLQLLTSDLALYHAFLCTSKNVVQEPPRHVAKSRIQVKSAPIALDDDDFIVPDELSQKKRLAKSKRPISHKVNYAASQPGIKRPAENGRTVENEIIVRKISGPPAQGNLREIISIANDLQDLIFNEDIHGLGEPAKTLLEQALLPSPGVGELAETSEVLSDLLSLARPCPVPDEPGLTVKRLDVPAWASPMDLPSDGLEFGRIYNHIVDHQLAPLADEIPPRFRMGREKIARTIAAELILSSSCIVMVDPLENSQEQDDSQATQHTLPFHGKGKERATDAFPSSSQLSNFMSSQPLPTPSPSASKAASIMSGTTTSLPSATSQTIMSRLSRHVNLSKSQTWAARPMKLLAHWDVGTDPSQYNYSQKVDELEKQRQEENMTDRQRLKAREKAERRLRRQRKEAEKVRSGLISSQPMVMSSQVRGGSQSGGGSQHGSSQFGRSSPLLPSSPPLRVEREGRFVGSSQALGPPMVGSSQAPGRKGDGQAKRKKRKREGF